MFRLISTEMAGGARATGPSGCGQSVPGSLARMGSAYKFSVPWSEVGNHTVSVLLHGAQVTGSPFMVESVNQVCRCTRPPTGLREHSQALSLSW